MQGAADEIHRDFNTTPSSVPNCINTTVSFDSSWKTRGFYSNLGFGSAISALTKKILDYELLNRICEKCARWPAERRDEQPEVYQKWYDSHKDNCGVNHKGANLWNRLLQSGYGVDLSRNANSTIKISSGMVTVRVTKKCVKWILTTESLFTKKNVWRMCLNFSRRLFENKEEHQKTCLHPMQTHRTSS